MAIEISILLPAFLAGFLIFCTHIPLGQEVLRRKIVFIDLALAQIASLGIMIPLLLNMEYLLHGASWRLSLFAMAFALIGAFIIEKLRRIFTENQEALVGSIYIVSFSLAVLIAATSPHGSEHLTAIIDGQLLWATDQQVFTLLLAALIFIGLIKAKPEILSSRYFYYLMAVIVVLSVQVIGVYLIFASLIIPALFNTKLGLKNWQLVATSSIALALGLLLSFNLDLPTSPLIIVIMLSVFSVFLCIAYFRHRIKDNQPKTPNLKP